MIEFWIEAYLQWGYKVLLTQIERTVYFQLEWIRRREGEGRDHSSLSQGDSDPWGGSDTDTSGGSDHVPLSSAIRSSDLLPSPQYGQLVAEQEMDYNPLALTPEQSTQYHRLVPDSVPATPPPENELQPQRPMGTMDLEDMGIQERPGEMVDLGAFRQRQPEETPVSPEVEGDSADDGLLGAEEGGSEISEDSEDDRDDDDDILDVEGWAQRHLSKIKGEIHYSAVKMILAVHLALELGYFDRVSMDRFMLETFDRLDRLQAMEQKRLKLMPKPSSSYTQVLFLGHEIFETNSGSEWRLPTRLVL